MGSPILGYRIYILTSDGITFGQDFTFCDGSQASIIAALSCEVPIATLIGSVYNLSYGSSVAATVVAYNSYGNSLNSTQGAGAVLITYPSAPTALAENIATRGATQIGITWV
jgi:hypothetical protein